MSIRTASAPTRPPPRTPATRPPLRPGSARRGHATATSPTRLPSCAGSPSATPAASRPEPGRGRLPPFPRRASGGYPRLRAEGSAPGRASAGLGGQAEAEADERDAGDPFEPSLHGGPAQPAGAAGGHPRQGGEPGAGFGDEPQPEDEGEQRRRGTGGDEAGQERDEEDTDLGVQQVGQQPIE